MMSLHIIIGSCRTGHCKGLPEGCWQQKSLHLLIVHVLCPLLQCTRKHTASGHQVACASLAATDLAGLPADSRLPPVSISKIHLVVCAGTWIASNSPQMLQRTPPTQQTVAL